MNELQLEFIKFLHIPVCVQFKEMHTPPKDPAPNLWLTQVERSVCFKLPWVR